MHVSLKTVQLPISIHLILPCSYHTVFDKKGMDDEMNLTGSTEWTWSHLTLSYTSKIWSYHSNLCISVLVFHLRNYKLLHKILFYIMIITVVRNSIFLPKPNPNPILNTDSIQDWIRIFLTQRFDFKTETEPNARNQIEPLHLHFWFTQILRIALTTKNLCGLNNWNEQDWDNIVR